MTTTKNTVFDRVENALAVKPALRDIK